jgi:polyisoprenoid-binding protein YceI
VDYSQRGRCSHLYIGPAASGTLNREDWGLTWNLPVDSGGVLVAKDIRIEI